MNILLDTCEAITGKRPKEVKQIHAELIHFIRENDAEGMIIDKNDLLNLFELSAIYCSTSNASELITDDLLYYFKSQELDQVVTEGKYLRPLENKNHLMICERLGKSVQSFHMDLTYKVTKLGVVFYDTFGAVFSYTNIKRIKGRPNETYAILTLNRIKDDKVRDEIVPQDYLAKKKWSYSVQKKFAVGKFFTSNELLECISDRKIITYGQY